MRSRALVGGRWLLPTVAAAPLVLVVATLVAVWVTKGGSDARGVASIESAGVAAPPEASVDRELVDGMRVALCGSVVERYEKPVMVREPDSQAFLVSMGRGEPVRAIDLAATSFDRLESIGGGRPVLVRGSFAKKPPGAEPFPGWAVQGYLALEFWTPITADQLPPEGARVTVLSKPGS